MYTPIRRIGRARGRLMSLARWAPADRVPVAELGLDTYRLTRRYDCPRRVERVYVYRWSPADPVR